MSRFGNTSWNATQAVLMSQPNNSFWYGLACRRADELIELIGQDGYDAWTETLPDTPTTYMGVAALLYAEIERVQDAKNREVGTAAA